MPDWDERGTTSACGRVLAAAALLACTSGCAVGLLRFSTPTREGDAPEPAGMQRVTVVGGYPALRKALEVALPARLGPDAVRFETTPVTPDGKPGPELLLAAEGLTVRISESSDYSPLTFTAVVSLLSLSVIPGYAAGEHRVVFTVLAADRWPRTFEYRYRERSVVWLPLVLFRPDFFVGLNGGWEREDGPNERVNREVAERFAADLAAFLGEG